MHPTIDLHVDTISRLVTQGGDWDGARPDLAVDLPRCREGGVRALCCACFVDDESDHPGEQVLAMLDRIDALDADPATAARKVTTAAELARLPEGTLGLVPTIENGRSLEGELATLDRFAAAGIALFGVTWNGANELATGCRVSDEGGLTRFGRAVVERAAEHRIALDISHLNRTGVDELLALGVPVLATHSNARTLHDHPRNLDDAQLDALAAAGGIVGLNLYPPFLGEDPTTLATFVTHARHVADRIGLDRVALGTDFDGIERTPEGIRDHRDLPALAAALGEGGFSDREVAGILGGNFLRWWGTVRPE